MKITVLGGCGAWPAPGEACSGYVVEHAGFRLLIDPGYATFPRLTEYMTPNDVDAVFVTHGHPDHCVDLNPLLRARAMSDQPPPALAAYAPPGELSAVMALDRPGMLDHAIDLREFEPGATFDIGPFATQTWLLPHYRPNAGVRLRAGGRTIAYTGDTGPTPLLADLARDADVFLAEASHIDDLPDDMSQYLSTAVQAGQTAAKAGVRHLVLTHLFPGTPHEAARAAAAGSFDGTISVARPGAIFPL